MRHADDADRRPWPGDHRCRVDRLLGADALQGGVDADAVSEVQDGLVPFRATRGDDVGCPELERDPLPVFSDVTALPNMARFIFLNPVATQFFDQWDNIAHDAVAILRGEAGRDPYDRRLTDLIGELSTRSDDFRVSWAAHDVKFHRTGAKKLHHPIVGDLTLDYEAMELPGDTGQRILVYSAEPGSPSDDALRPRSRLARLSPLASASSTVTSMAHVHRTFDPDRVPAAVGGYTHEW